jgi:hypothetical protein
MARARAGRHLSVLLLLALYCPANASSLETWKANQDAAAKASKLAHFPEAEKFLLANQGLAGTFSSNDARLPRTIFDLPQVYRAEENTPMRCLRSNGRCRSISNFTAPNRRNSRIRSTEKPNFTRV